MTEFAKETIVIVHGTRAAPERGTKRWYEPSDSAPAADGFVAKLNAALQERDSPARCWAHCAADGNPIFSWSGANSWIDRTHAASDFGDYVVDLQNKGWRCHIVAHSHGGNVIVEALPRILAAPSTGRLGKITTLGTPFFDTISAISQARTRELLNYKGYILTTCVFVAAAMFLIFFSGLFFEQSLLPIIMPILFVAGLVVTILITTTDFGGIFYRALFFRAQSDEERAHSDGGAAGLQLPFLAIGSPMDEAWQILHHMRNINNPLAVKSNLKSYVSYSLQSHMLQAAEATRLLHEAKSFKEMTVVGKLKATIGFLPGVFPLVIPLVFALNTDAKYGIVANVAIFFILLIFCHLSIVSGARSNPSAYYSDFSLFLRWYARLTDAIASIPNDIAIFTVRWKAWSVLQGMAMGLEGYPFELPQVERQPSQVSDDFIKCEDMPKDAVDSALEKRNAWINGHFGDVTETFANMAVTTADINSLLHRVEADQSLVHAAYYTDDMCIARIADWISGKG